MESNNAIKAGFKLFHVCLMTHVAVLEFHFYRFVRSKVGGQTTLVKRTLKLTSRIAHLESFHLIIFIISHISALFEVI